MDGSSGPAAWPLILKTNKNHKDPLYLSKTCPLDCWFLFCKEWPLATGISSQALTSKGTLPGGPGFGNPTFCLRHLAVTNWAHFEGEIAFAGPLTSSTSIPTAKETLPTNGAARTPDVTASATKINLTLLLTPSRMGKATLT